MKVFEEILRRLYKDHYLDRGLTLEELAPIVGVSKQTMFAYFSKLQLPTLSKKERAQVRVSRVMCNDEAQKIYQELYLGRGLGVGQIADELGMKESTLNNIFTKMELQKRPKGTQKVFQINSDTLMESPELYYWAGFIAADGCLQNKNIVKFTLQIGDKDQLKKFNLFFGFPYFIGNNDKSVYLAVAHYGLYQFLESLGMCPRKSSFDIDYLARVPKQYRIPFIMGYFDGDGCLGKFKTSFQLGFLGTFTFLQSVENFLGDLGLKFNKIYDCKRGNIWRSRLATCSYLRFTELYLCESFPKLDRKKHRMLLLQKYRLSLLENIVEGSSCV